MNATSVYLWIAAVAALFNLCRFVHLWLGGYASLAVLVKSDIFFSLVGRSVLWPLHAAIRVLPRSGAQSIKMKTGNVKFGTSDSGGVFLSSDAVIGYAVALEDVLETIESDGAPRDVTLKRLRDLRAVLGSTDDDLVVTDWEV